MEKAKLLLIGNISLFFLIFFVILSFNYQNLSLPYVWDDANYVIPTAIDFEKEGFKADLTEGGIGHPPFFFILLGSLFALFGELLVLSHLIIIFFSAVALYFTYKIGLTLFNPRVGIFSALLLFFYPVFFAHSGLVFLSIPITALFVVTVYAWIKQYKILYLFAGTFLVLTNILEVGLVFILSGYLFFERLKKKEPITSSLLSSIFYLLPLLPLLAWLVYNKIISGHYLSSIHVGLIRQNILEIVLNLFYVIKTIFFDFFTWLLLLFVLLSYVFFATKLPKKELFKKTAGSLLVTILVSLALYFASFFLVSYGQQFFPQVSSYFDHLFSLWFFVYFFIMFLIIFLLKALLNDVLEKENRLLLLLIVLFIGAYSLLKFDVRYSLPLFPLIFILFVGLLYKNLKNVSSVFVILMVIVYGTQYTLPSDRPGFSLTNNLEYKYFVKVNIDATQYLEENYKDAYILAPFPQSLYLNYPYLGYVNEPLHAPLIIPKQARRLVGYREPEINLNDVELIYFSPQSYPTHYIDQALRTLDYTVLKEFNDHNKSVILYKVIKS